jgi:hypothetical protein
LREKNEDKQSPFFGLAFPALPALNFRIFTLRTAQKPFFVEKSCFLENRTNYQPKYPGKYDKAHNLLSVEG